MAHGPINIRSFLLPVKFNFVQFLYSHYIMFEKMNVLNISVQYMITGVQCAVQYVNTAVYSSVQNVNTAV